MKNLMKESIAMNILDVFTASALTFGIVGAHAQNLPMQPQVHYQTSATPDAAPAAVPAATQAATPADVPVARPGHVPGVGQSLPMSDKASNITASDTSSTIAPTLPAALNGADSTPRAFLQEARDDLTAGRTGQAQEALEMAETRTLDRVIPPGESSGPSQSQMVGLISAARVSLGNGDIPKTIDLIDQALKI